MIIYRNNRKENDTVPEEFSNFFRAMASSDCLREIDLEMFMKIWC